MRVMLKGCYSALVKVYMKSDKSTGVCMPYYERNRYISHRCLCTVQSYIVTLRLYLPELPLLRWSVH